MRFAASRTGLQFEGFNPSGAGGRGIAAAGGMATGASALKAARARAPQYAKFGQMGVQAQGAKFRADQNAQSRIAQQGISSFARFKADQETAKAYKAAAAKKSQGAMGSSIIGAVASIGMGLLSDQTTKNTVTEIEDGLRLIRKLRPVKFFYNEEYTDEPWRSHYGFIAQEYDKVCPDQVHLDTEINKLCIDTNELIAVLVKSIQQLEKRLEVLER